MAIFGVVEDEPLQIELCEPQHKGNVVSPIKPMPEGTNQEHKQLVLGLAFEVMALVDAAVEPFLHLDVPVVDFLAHVDACLDLEDVNSVDAAEILTVVAHS